MTFPKEMIVLSTPNSFSEYPKRVFLTKESNLESAATAILKEVQLKVFLGLSFHTLEDTYDYLLEEEDSEWFEKSLLKDLDPIKLEADLKRVLTPLTKTKYHCQLRFYDFLFNFNYIRFQQRLSEDLSFLVNEENKQAVIEAIKNFDFSESFVEVNLDKEVIQTIFISTIEEMKAEIPYVIPKLESIGYFEELSDMFNKEIQNYKSQKIYVDNADNFIFIN